MVATVAYEDNGTVIANGAGVATFTFSAPGPPIRRLAIDSLVVLVTGSTTLPTCSVYDGFVAVAGRLRGSTLIGNRNTFESTGDVLFPGQAITVQWTGASPGAVCNAVLRGSSA